MAVRSNIITPFVLRVLIPFDVSSEWMMFVDWRGWLLFCAPAGLPALLLVSWQSLWEWLGEWLPVAGCWSRRLQSVVVWLWNRLQSLVTCSDTSCCLAQWREQYIGQSKEVELLWGKGSHWPCGVPTIISASVSKSERSKKAGLWNFFLDWFQEYKGIRILQNLEEHSSTDTASHPRIHETVITLLWEPQSLTQKFLLSLGLDTSLILRACKFIKLLSNHCRCCLSAWAQDGKTVCYKCPTNIRRSCHSFCLLSPGSFWICLGCVFSASYFIRKWSAAGINFKWTLFVVHQWNV